MNIALYIQDIYRLQRTVAQWHDKNSEIFSCLEYLKIGEHFISLGMYVVPFVIISIGCQRRCIREAVLKGKRSARDSKRYLRNVTKRGSAFTGFSRLWTRIVIPVCLPFDDTDKGQK